MPRHSESTGSYCLTNELLAELIDGQLTWEELASAHRHASECLNCNELLVALVRGGILPEAGRARPLTNPAAFLQSENSFRPSAVDWLPPPEFDEFRLVRLLGRGAMGVVYLAHDSSLDRQVAVKFIATHPHHPRVRHHFQTEARAIARLQHPNVVTVFRVGAVHGHPYIVSEYLAGQSLAELRLPLPWRRTLDLGVRLSRGLAAAHRQGVLHRDIKPANIFLTSEGEVKLLDFGLAELVDGGTPATSNGVRAPAGTPRYMAPEILRGRSAIPQSDIYSLGLVLYELCTGTLPPWHRCNSSLSSHEQQDMSEQAEPSRSGSSHPLTTRMPGIDLDFASIIERCLRVDPAERFASAETLRAALEQLHEPSVIATGNPYRGLAPFEAEHRSLFFGRDADIRAVLERLRRQPLVLVAGDSGVGKSSLCRAGILPRISQGALDEYRDFSILTLEPGRRPLAALAAVLAPILGQTEDALGIQLLEAPGEPAAALRATLQEERGLLLFIDQLEELVTVSDPVQATRFTHFLGELALPATGLRVLLTLRGDFLTRLGALPGLGSEVERALYLLRPLPPHGVREAIVGPARSRGVFFESEALVQTLAEATAQGTGSLPLLQFTLAELWERRDPARDCITQAALDEMGGVAGALSRHADGVLSRLDRTTQRTARCVLGRLITAEGTRCERSEEELTATPDETRVALRVLVEGRLLHVRTRDGRASYELAHEALISSWGTLRHWLDEDAIQRALRQRIEAAGAEWERLGRSTDVLWRKRQLDEARALDTSLVGRREQDFLHASQRAVRRQRLLRWCATLLLLLGVGGSYGGLSLKTHLETQRFVHAQIVDAQAMRARGRALSQRANAIRGKALTLFDGHAPSDTRVPPPPQDLRALAEKEWAQALETLEQADALYSEAEQALDDALDRAHDHRGVRQLLSELTFERLVLAEHFHLENEQAHLIKQLRRLAARDTAWLQQLDAPAELNIETQPSGASVELTRYVDTGKGLRRQPILDHIPPRRTPMARMSLPAGSYQLRLTWEGHAPVDLPILLRRGQVEQVHLKRPPAAPKGYVYVPPGCTFTGSTEPEEVRKFLLSAPLDQRCLKEGYFIGQTELTLGDWLTYLDTLPEGAKPRRLLAKMRASMGSALRLWKLPNGTWSFSLRLENGDVLSARDGEPIRYPGRSHRREQNWRRFPLTGVTAEELTGYLEWLDRSGRLPGARLCNELEWTRAARGADERRFPHGSQFHQDDANIDETYAYKHAAMGPDEVDAHRVSMSPFGLLGMAGNAFEMTKSMTPGPNDIVLRGGAWYYGEVGALIANRQLFKSEYHDTRVGVRLCSSTITP